MFGKKTSRAGTVIGILVFILVFYFLAKHTDFITELLTRSGAWAPIVALVLYPLLAPVPITTDPITIIVGVTYGPLIGVIIAFIGNTSASVVEYYMGYKIGDTVNFEGKGKKSFLGLEKLPVNSIPFLIFGRMIPGYGSKVISILAGGYRVPLKRYVWTSAVTNLLGSVLMAYGGSSLINMIK